MEGIDQHVLQTHFGAFLKMQRLQWGVRQREVLLYFPGWTQANYSRLESGAIAPAFDQLLPLYSALLRAGVQWNATERQRFLALARKRIEEKKRHTEQHQESEWAGLRYQMAEVDFFPDEPSTPATPWTPPRPLLAETRHLLGREAWYGELIGAVQSSAPKKLVVVQGPVGIGKSSALHRLIQHFISATDPAYHVIWIPLLPAERGAGPESSLEVVLGNMLAESGSPALTPEMASWQQRQRLALAQLEQSARPVVILVDNAESLLTEDGMLAACWEEFLDHFLRHQHRATLIMATKEWPGWSGRNRALVYESTVPALDMPTSILLLQQQGLEAVPVEQLQEVWRRIGGIPLYLEWVASLAQYPHQLNEWQSFDIVEEEHGQVVTGDKAEQEISQRLSRLLAEPMLLRGHLASKLRPLLERIIDKRLSSEARALLDALAVCNVPLGKTALQTLCEHPGLINELRNASLLVSYAHRVQVLPIVAAVVTQGLTAEQIYELEKQTIRALRRWKKEGSINDSEAGNVIAELVMLLIKHHRLLNAAQHLLSYHPLISNSGHAPRLARFAQAVMNEFNWRATPETECGGLLLYHTLAPFLGLTILDKERVTAYQQILSAVSTGKAKIWASVEAYLIGYILEPTIDELGLEEAQALLETAYARLKSLQPENADLQVYLLEVQARLLGVWSDYLEEQGEKLMAQALRKQAISLYRKCSFYSSADEVLSSLKSHLLKIRLSSYSNDLAYHLAREGEFEEALRVIDSSIALKEQGYFDFGTLASSYGEKAEILMELGRYQEALLFDEKALTEAQRLANTGHTLSQEEVWMYLANRGRLYLCLGRIDEAEQFLRESLPHIHPRRRIYHMFAKDALDEIEQWRQTKSSRYQLDWRWVDRYRELASFDSFWWLAPAGPFSETEQRQWNEMFASELDETTKGLLGKIVAETCQRELEVAIQEQREPRLHYPALAIDEVRSRIAGLLYLDTEIMQNEPSAIVRRFYHDTIEEEVWFLFLIEATYEGDSEDFWEYNRRLNPVPTSEEMSYALSRVGQVIQRGLSQAETKEASERLLRLMRQQLGLSIDLSSNEQNTSEIPQERSTSISQSKQKISVQAARRFFESALIQAGYEGWQVIIDANASSPRVEQGLRHLYLPEIKLSLSQIKHYLSHELAGHVGRCIAGEHSLLGLLGIHSKSSLETEEGLAVYYDRQIEVQYGQTHNDTSIWSGTLATGLASGVLTSPQTFLSLYTFFRAFYWLYQLLQRPDANAQKVQQRASKYALSLCLRTFRGVPNLERPGVCYTKDALYLRGLWKIERAAAQDKMVLDYLAVGVVALDRLSDLQELGIVVSPQPLRKLANDPGLDTYILAFEEAEKPSIQDV